MGSSSVDPCRTGELGFKSRPLHLKKNFFDLDFKDFQTSFLCFHSPGPSEIMAVIHGEARRS
jgi:hypothetical protein